MPTKTKKGIVEKVLEACDGLTFDFPEGPCRRGILIEKIKEKAEQEGIKLSDEQMNEVFAYIIQNKEKVLDLGTRSECPERSDRDRLSIGDIYFTKEVITVTLRKVV